MFNILLDELWPIIIKHVASDLGNQVQVCHDPQNATVSIAKYGFIKSASLKVDDLYL